MPPAEPARSATDAPNDPEDPHAALRAMGASAHRLHAAMRAADHYLALDGFDDRNTGSWLISGALALANELAGDIDALARALRERPTDAALRATVDRLRVCTHQLQATARAADHFLDQDARADHETGGWLVASAWALARKLATDMDDSAAPARRGAVDGIEGHDAGLARRIATASRPLSGA